MVILHQLNVYLGFHHVQEAQGCMKRVSLMLSYAAYWLHSAHKNWSWWLIR